ncbi:hypothetical protein GGD81_004591 [Rhodobium orientis]|uniref:Sulfotransferase domain-containing protein n=1 Tax=Rhodobium orientis TaxID=34017 RepID=A0A327JHD1_9HYPH|nr:sulfotransferase [Rhodobium orientis]MBB4305511.1 hypothetical protein [Rhodobium orientis]MBK5949850.1 hypothetical protein [Rhodobium orientis]RAI24724.1 hypothetical protein CH339_21385 [Rhodobium orientis]
MARKPNFIVLGQDKSGTSLFYRVFDGHPEIALSRKKELHFFNSHWDEGIDWYLDFFDETDKPFIGEISPSYIYSAKIVERVHSVLGSDAKIVFILRRPIEQLYSRYLQNICANREAPDFDFVLEKVTANRKRGIINSLTKVYELFGEENVLPLFYEKDVATSEPTFEQKIYAHLGVADRTPRHVAPSNRVNSGVMPRFLAAGDEPLEIVQDGVRYRIPKNRLVFCGQPRNSKIWRKADPEAIRKALESQKSWQTEISEELYARLLEEWVEPYARELEERFGYDMDHWRVKPRRIAYDPAPPPERLIVE